MDGAPHAWVFDHSSCHAAMADDALDVNHMNVNPGGKQRVMHETIWNGKYQKMTLGNGIPKGMKLVLQERGIDMVADDMRTVLAKHPDFRDEKSLIEIMLGKNGHIPVFLPKFHPELNPIERVWAQLKRYTKAHCKYSFPSLKKNIALAYQSVSIENIKNHFRKIRHYMVAYLEGHTPGTELDEIVKKYKKVLKSHPRIVENE